MKTIKALFLLMLAGCGSPNPGHPYVIEYVEYELSDVNEKFTNNPRRTQLVITDTISGKHYPIGMCENGVCFTVKLESLSATIEDGDYVEARSLE